MLDNVLNDILKSGDSASVPCRLGERSLNQLQIAVREAHELLENRLSV